MRTSLIETQQIEYYIQQRSSVSNHSHKKLNHQLASECLLIEARLQIDPELAERVAFQQQTYRVIQEYGRRQLLAEIQQVQKRIFGDSAYRRFQTKVRSYFKI